MQSLWKIGDTHSRGGLIEFDGREYRVTPQGDVYVRIPTSTPNRMRSIIERRTRYGGPTARAVNTAFGAAIASGIPVS